MVDWLGTGVKVLKGDLLALKKIGKATGQEMVGEATGGLLGTPPSNNGGGEGIGGVQRRPTAAEAAQGLQGQVRGNVNGMTQNVLNRFEQGRTQTPNLAATVESAPGRFLGAILPSQGMMNRLAGGAAAFTATVGGVADKVQEALADDKKPGVYTEQGPDGNPVTVDTNEIEGRGSAPAAAPPERSWWQRLTGAAASATAAVATAVTVAATPAAAAPEAPQRTTSESTTSVLRINPTEIAAIAPIKIEPLKPIELSLPAVTTAVSPAADFAVAASPVAAPAKPSPTFGIDATITEATQNGANADRLETLRKAREQIANLGAPGGPG